MANAFNGIEPLLEKIEDYGKVKIELYKLKTINQIAKVTSAFVSRAVFMIALSMFFVFASLGLAIYLNHVLENSYIGFFTVAGFYLLLGGVFYLFLHNRIKRKISNAIIFEFFNK